MDLNNIIDDLELSLEYLEELKSTINDSLLLFRVEELIDKYKVTNKVNLIKRAKDQLWNLEMDSDMWNHHTCDTEEYD